VNKGGVDSQRMGGPVVSLGGGSDGGLLDSLRPRGVEDKQRYSQSITEGILWGGWIALVRPGDRCVCLFSSCIVPLLSTWLLLYPLPTHIPYTPNTQYTLCPLPTLLPPAVCILTGACFQNMHFPGSQIVPFDDDRLL
jgi:hypothetical protein